MVLFCPTSASDPGCTSTYRQHVSATGVCCPGPRGIYIDADLTMSTHVTTTVRACFAALQRIRSVRRYLTRDALLTLLRALVITSVDYCCSVLTGVSTEFDF